jgi:hypothetical protein
MTKLLRANFARLRKEKIFLVCAAVMVLYGVILCIAVNYSMHVNNTEIPFDSVFLYGYGLYGYLAIPGILMATLCSVFIGTEHSDGTIRNKLVVGRTRTEIYLSNFLTCAVAGVLLNICYFVVACAVGIPLFGFFHASVSVMLKLILDGTLMMVSYAAVFNILSMLIQNKTTTAIISLIGVIAVMCVSIVLITRIAEPEFIDGIEISASGEQIWTTVRNTRYLSKTARAVCQFVVDLLPTGQSLQISGMTAPHLWLMMLYSAIITITANIAGVFFFRRKDLK